MAKMTYFEQLRHPNWQRKRLEVMNRDRFTCQACGNTEGTLNVHHKQYFKGRLAWEYADSELVTLCEPCHEEQGGLAEAVKLVLATLSVDGPRSMGAATSLLAGWAQAPGHDFNEQFMHSPESFIVGEIAHLLEHTVLNVYVLGDILAGMRALPRPELEARFMEFAESLSKPAPHLVIPPRKGLDPDDVI